MAAAQSPGGGDITGFWGFLQSYGWPTLSFTSLLAAFGFGTKYQMLKTQVDRAHERIDEMEEASAKQTDKLEAKIEALVRDHAALAVSVAAIPTRGEMNDGFESVREQIMGLVR